MTQANLCTCIDFYNGDEGRSGNLYSYGDELYSYSTMIAKRINDDIILISRYRFTNTTARHLHDLRSVLDKDSYYEVPVDWGSAIDSSYIKKEFLDDINYFLKNKDCLKRKPNRVSFRKLWNDAIRYNDYVEKFIDTPTKIKVHRLLSEIKQDK